MPWSSGRYRRRRRPVDKYTYPVVENVLKQRGCFDLKADCGGSRGSGLYCKRSGEKCLLHQAIDYSDLRHHSQIARRKSKKLRQLLQHMGRQRRTGCSRILYLKDKVIVLNDAFIISRK